MFKGIFKRGKKNKQDGPGTDASAVPAQQQQQQPYQPSAAPAQSQAPQVDTQAPQLPPIGNASPLSGATESSKPIPPTHPLSTGEQKTAQEALPQKVDAEPAPGPPLGGGAAAATSEAAPATGGLKEPEKLAAGAGGTDVSPPASTMDVPDAPKSDAVSAISNDQPKTDGVAEDVPPTPTMVEESKGMGTSRQHVSAELTGQAAEPSTQPPTTTTTTTTDATTTVPNATTTETTDAAPAATKENIPPVTNGTSPTEPASTSTDAAPSAPPNGTTTTATTDSKPAAADEKMPAMEEPPPIKAVRAAPGMSATSGPLEDYPEGGDVKDQ